MNFSLKIDMSYNKACQSIFGYMFHMTSLWQVYGNVIFSNKDLMAMVKSMALYEVLHNLETHHYLHKCSSISFASTCTCNLDPSSKSSFQTLRLSRGSRKCQQCHTKGSGHTSDLGPVQQSAHQGDGQTRIRTSGCLQAGPPVGLAGDRPLERGRKTWSGLDQSFSPAEAPLD